MPKGGAGLGQGRKPNPDKKQLASIRFDPEVLKWLRSRPNYNAFLNQLVAERMQSVEAQYLWSVELESQGSGEYGQLLELEFSEALDKARDWVKVQGRTASLQPDFVKGERDESGCLPPVDATVQSNLKFRIC